MINGECPGNMYNRHVILQRYFKLTKLRYVAENVNIMICGAAPDQISFSFDKLILKFLYLLCLAIARAGQKQQDAISCPGRYENTDMAEGQGRELLCTRAIMQHREKTFLPPSLIL